MQANQKKSIGKYSVFHTLGAGATAEVKLGLNTENNQMVALKFLKSGLSPQIAERILQEVQLM